MIKEMNKRVKKISIWDVGLVKAAVVAGTLFLITIWPALMGWVHTVNPWWFLVAFMVLAAKPFSNFYLK